MSREITQGELRSNAAAVLRAVAAGESFVVTRHGRPVAQLSAGCGKPTFFAIETLRTAPLPTGPA